MAPITCLTTIHCDHGAMGAPRDVLPAIAAAALKDHCHATNPRATTEGDYQRIRERSFRVRSFSARTTTRARPPRTPR